MLKVPKVTSLQYLEKNKVKDNFFCMQISIKVSLKQIPSFLVAMAMHVQSTQTNKFVIYLQYLKKEGRHEVDFLHGDKQTFLQVDAINIVEYCHSCRKYSKNEDDFCTDKHQSIQKVGTIIFDGCSQACLKYSK